MPRVVFDLGGVLVKVARTWGEAATTAGYGDLSTQVSAQPLVNFLGLEQFQAGKLTLEEYAQQLAHWLELESSSSDQALQIHQGILMDVYPGTMEIVDELHRLDYPTGCLSNTNAPHWDHMTGSGLFPNVAQLQFPGLSHVMGMEKPHATIYRAYEELCQTPSHSIIFFDDSLANVDAAKRAGWRAHRIDPAGDTASQIRLHLADLGL